MEGGSRTLRLPQGLPRPSLEGPDGASISTSVRVGLTAATVAFFAGSLIVIRPPLGLALALGFCYALIALANLPLAIAIWAGLIWIEQLPGVNALLVAAAVLMAASWFGSLRSRLDAVFGMVSRHRFLIGAVALFLLWITVSLAWAGRPALGGAELWHWYVAGAFLLIFVTTVSRGRHVTLVVWAVVLGTALTVAIGLVDIGVARHNVPEARLALEQRPRLWGGGSDPNFLAAGLVSGIVLAAALIACTRAKALRAGLVVAIAVLGVGLIATQSRGGLVAALAALVVALVVLPGRRKWVLLVAVLALGTMGVRLATSPEALQRVTTTADHGSGRVDLFRAGWAVAEDAPLLGVGLGNFPAESRYYARRLYGLERGEYLIERPKVVHNAWLEMLAEAGIVGVLLWAAVVAASLSAALRAAVRFDARGERALATLARAVVVAVAAMLAAAFFISSGHDRRLWLLLALGPALLSVAARRATTGIGSTRALADGPGVGPRRQATDPGR